MGQGASNALNHEHQGIDPKNDPQHAAVTFPKGGNLAALVFAAISHHGARLGDLGNLAITVRELLRSARRGLVYFGQVFEQPKAGAEFVVQRIRTIPNHI
jgi:hypothetical protein